MAVVLACGEWAPGGVGDPGWQVSASGFWKQGSCTQGSGAGRKLLPHMYGPRVHGLAEVDFNRVIVSFVPGTGISLKAWQKPW